VIHEEVARADLSISYINLLASLNGQILADHGKPEVVKPWLTRLTQGQALLAIALTEPRGGSDAGNLRLRVERIGDHYVINARRPRSRPRPGRRGGGVRPHRHGRIGRARCDRAAGARRCARADAQSLRLPRPARDRPRLAVLRERARAGGPRLGDENRASCR